MRMYMVGGVVRDELLGLKSKDIDFSVVLDPYEVTLYPFDYMVGRLREQRFEIFLLTPQYLTARARFPRGHKHEGVTADFVLARHEEGYTDGRRPDFVRPGSLYDDLARRDFTMNAIAKDDDGNYIDPHDGIRDIENRIIRAVGDPYDRLTEDPLRALRAIRFMVTKEFNIDSDLFWAIRSPEVIEGIRSVSDERIADEIGKMFRFNTVAALFTLDRFAEIVPAIFSGQVSLDSSMKTKGRG